MRSAAYRVWLWNTTLLVAVYCNAIYIFFLSVSPIWPQFWLLTKHAELYAQDSASTTWQHFEISVVWTRVVIQQHRHEVHAHRHMLNPWVVEHTVIIMGHKLSLRVLVQVSTDLWDSWTWQMLAYFLTPNPLLIFCTQVWSCTKQQWWLHRWVHDSLRTYFPWQPHLGELLHYKATTHSYIVALPPTHRLCDTVGQGCFCLSWSSLDQGHVRAFDLMLLHSKKVSGAGFLMAEPDVGVILCNPRMGVWLFSMRCFVLVRKSQRL